MTNTPPAEMLAKQAIAEEFINWLEASDYEITRTPSNPYKGELDCKRLAEIFAYETEQQAKDTMWKEDQS